MAAGLVFGFGAQSQAQSAGEQVSGSISDLELGNDPPRMKVRLDSGQTATVYMDRSTRISVSGRRDAELADLREGMQVSFDWPNDRFDVVRQVRVEDGRNRRGQGRVEDGRNRNDQGRDDRWYSGSGSDLKVRVLDINQSRGEFEADVAGRRQRFATENSGMLNRFEEGDLAIITVRRQGNRSVVVQMRSASVRGRVVEVDERRGEIVISANGRETTYYVDNTRVLQGARRGDTIRFEFEDRRNGRKVITEIF